MTLANDSITVTPGTGATVATHTVSSKEHQVVMVANADGHIKGSKDTYIYTIPAQVHVAAASTIHWDLWNNDASKLVRVMSIRQIPDIVTAVTGVATTWTIQRTTTIGTGGSTITPWLPDTSQTAMDADITMRSKPAGGAAAGTALLGYTIHSEETNTATQACAVMTAGGVYDLVPRSLRDNEQGILLRPSEGISCTQTTNSAAGNTAWMIEVTVE